MGASPGGREPAVASPVPSLSGGLPPLPVAGAVAGTEELRTVQQMVLIERWMRAIRAWAIVREGNPEKVQEPDPHGPA